MFDAYFSSNLFVVDIRVIVFKNSYTYSMKGLKFDIIPSRFEETLDKSAFKHPHEYVLENSKQKALEVAGRIDKVSVSCTCMYIKIISILIE